MISKADWPWTSADAIGAEIIPWESEQLGVLYSFPDGTGRMHSIGPNDWPAITRLAQAGKLKFHNGNVRERMERLREE